MLAQDSARDVDANGFISIEDNPISREGVFQYLGKSISKECDPDKIYNVYRPASELSNPETIESFKLLPWIDDHAMLGPAASGLTPAEKKGMHGTTGERVDFRDGVLYANLKVFSEKLANLIQAGKKELSLGYRCLYEKAPGVFAGQPYEWVQRSLKGNHIASVDSSRCNVAVLDQHITMDHFDINLEETEMPITMDELDKKITEAMDAAIAKAMLALDAKAKDDDKEEEKKDMKKGEDDAESEAEKEKGKKAEDADMESEGGSEKAKAKVEDADEEKEDKKEMKKDGMDAAITGLRREVSTLQKNAFKSVMTEVSKRNALADKLSHYVGAFDASEMTLSEVETYGVTKLALPAVKGQEGAVLAGFLHGRTSPASGAIATFDSKERSTSKVNDFYNKTA